MNNQNTQTILLNNMMVELVKTEAGHYLVADNIIDAINAEIARLRKVEANVKMMWPHFEAVLDDYTKRRYIDEDSLCYGMLSDFRSIYENYRISK